MRSFVLVVSAVCVLSAAAAVLAAEEVLSWDILQKSDPRLWNKEQVAAASARAQPAYLSRDDLLDSTFAKDIGAAPADFMVTFTMALRHKQDGVKALEQQVLHMSDPKHPDFYKTLTKDEILDMVAPDAQDVEKVVTWLQSCGVAASAIENRRDSLRWSAPVAVAERVLAVQFRKYTLLQNGDTAVKHLPSASTTNDEACPLNLAGVEAETAAVLARTVVFSEGVTSLAADPHHRAVRQYKASVSAAATATTAAATGQTIEPLKLDNPLLASAGDNDVPAFLSTLRKQYNLPNYMKSRGTTNYQSAAAYGAYAQACSVGEVVKFLDQDNQNWAVADKLDFSPASNAGCMSGSYYCSEVQGRFNNKVESCLDVQQMMGIAPLVRTRWWQSQTWIYSHVADILALGATNQPLVHSMSYGYPSSLQCKVDPQCTTYQDYIDRTNAEILKANGLRMTVVVASGDDGASGMASTCSSQLRPDYPGCSVYVLSVGATMFSTDTNEVVCSGPKAMITSGGGFSLTDQASDFQAPLISAYLRQASGRWMPPATMFDATKRGFPDISALGHKYYECVSNPCNIDSCYYTASCSGCSSDMSCQSGTDGTSASCPVIAAMVTLLNERRLATGRPAYGFINPVLYEAYQDDATIFNDITSGDNHYGRASDSGSTPECQYGFPATPGWDPATGLGTPNFLKLYNYLCNIDTWGNTASAVAKPTPSVTGDPSLSLGKGATVPSFALTLKGHIPNKIADVELVFSYDNDNVAPAGSGVSGTVTTGARMNCSYNTGAIMTLPASTPAACAAACAGDARCQVWTFNPAQQSCQLQARTKSSTAAPSMQCGDVEDYQTVVTFQSDSTKVACGTLSVQVSYCGQLSQSMRVASNSCGNKIGLIVGLVVGITCLLMIIGCVWWFRRRRAARLASAPLLQEEYRSDYPSATSTSAAYAPPAASSGYAPYQYPSAPSNQPRPPAYPYQPQQPQQPRQQYYYPQQQQQPQGYQPVRQ